MEINKILQGNCIEVLKTLPDESIDCCVTSPPYFGLRDYGTAEWEGGDVNCEHMAEVISKRETGQSGATGRGSDTTIILVSEKLGNCQKCGAKRIDSQLGLEDTPQEYVAKMVEVFREVRRVLKKEGTLWLNLGDSYNANYRWGNTKDMHEKWASNRGQKQSAGKSTHIQGLQSKQLMGTPWRVAFALQADGWWLRQDIIWHKPNPMPESITDRCTKSHEYVFLLAKSAQYYFDNEAIKEKSISEGSVHVDGNEDKMTGLTGFDTRPSKTYITPELRNKRSVWTVSTKPYSGAHFATFPENLIIPMIKAGTSEKGVCPDCGKAWERIIEYGEIPERKPREDMLNVIPGRDMVSRLNSQDMEMIPSKTIGWKPQCICGKEPIPAIVFDPFSGAGTTCMVAKKLWRNYIGIELNPEYVKLTQDRIDIDCGTLF
jgi:DNA modification methylase